MYTLYKKEPKRARSTNMFFLIKFANSFGKWEGTVEATGRALWRPLGGHWEATVNRAVRVPGVFFGGSPLRGGVRRDQPKQARGGAELGNDPRGSGAPPGADHRCIKPFQTHNPGQNLTSDGCWLPSPFLPSVQSCLGSWSRVCETQANIIPYTNIDFWGKGGSGEEKNELGSWQRK